MKSLWLILHPMVKKECVLLGTRQGTSVIRQDKEIKALQITEEEGRLSLFTDDVITYVENPMEATEKLLELTSELSKSMDIRPIYKNQLCFYMLVMKNQKLKPFTIASNIKYLGTKLTKDFIH